MKQINPGSPPNTLHGERDQPNSGQRRFRDKEVHTHRATSSNGVRQAGYRYPGAQTYSQSSLVACASV